MRKLKAKERKQCSHAIVKAPFSFTKQLDFDTKLVTSC